MLLALLDANTLASAAIAGPGSTLASLLDAWIEEQFIAAISPEILAELDRTLQKPYFSSRIDAATRTNFLSLVQQSAHVVPISVDVRGVASHPEDDLVLAAALSCKA